ncbi:hypothetical protein C9975_03350 [Thalassospira xiamenensis]|nr:hypothetical protein C9975_03350 [Thalassospira xiamenensis]
MKVGQPVIVAPICLWVTSTGISVDMIKNRIAFVATVFALLSLVGCQTTQPYEVSRASEYGPERAKLLQVARDICIANLGDAEAIDRLALPMAEELPIIEEEQLGNETVKTRVYRIIYKGRHIGAISNSEGRACSVAAAAGIGMPDYFTEQLGLVIEDKDFALVGSDIDEMRYGYRETAAHPVKKMVTRVAGVGKVDIILFMTQEAYEAERSFVEGAKKMTENAHRPEIAGGEVALTILQDICAPNMGDRVAMRSALGEFTGAAGKSYTDKRLWMFGDKIEMFPLLRSPDGTMSMAMMAPDGESCGIWEVGKPKPVKDIFARIGVELLGEEGIDDGIMRYGYRASDEVVFLNLTRVRPDQTINGMFFMQRDAFSRIPSALRPPLPQGI